MRRVVDLVKVSVVKVSLVDVGEAGHRCQRQPLPVRQVAAGDEDLLRVRAEPVGASPDQLVDLVVADPVVLGVVEDRQQDVQVIQRISEPDAASEVNVEIPRLPPRRNGGIQRDGGRRDLPAERREQAAQQVGAATARDGGQADFQRYGGRGQVRTRVAAAGERCPEHVLERHRQHAGRGVRAIVDVLPQGEPVAGRSLPPADQGDWIHLK